VHPYSAAEADARIVLQSLRDGVYLKEALLLSLRLNATHILLITSGRMLLASAKDHRCHRHYPLQVSALNLHP